MLDFGFKRSLLSLLSPRRAKEEGGGGLKEPPKAFLQQLFNEKRYRDEILANCQ